MKICKYKGPAGECGAVRRTEQDMIVLCGGDPACPWFTPLTNLDRVRAMDIPALAEILIDGCTERISQEHCDRYDRDCSACWAAWLAAEAEEDA